MQTYIVTGSSLASRSEYITTKVTSSTELFHLVSEKSSLTIKQVQALSASLSIIPRLPRLIWIEEANLLTIPAQNALLKLLEEPPANTTIYLTTQAQSSLLPTIRSRCQVITLLNHQPPAHSAFRTADTDGSTINHLQSLKTIMGLSPGDRLMSIEKRDRAETILWITQLETALRVKLASPNLTKANYQTLAKIASLTQNAHKELLSNCSISLVIQNFYLLLPHTHSPR